MTAKELSDITRKMDTMYESLDRQLGQLSQAGDMGVMYGGVTCGLGQLGNDISRQLGQQQQLHGGAIALSGIQRSWLYDAMSSDSIRQACGPTFDYHYNASQDPDYDKLYKAMQRVHSLSHSSDTHISEWSKTPPSPEVRLDKKFPCLAQARRKRVRMKKLIITAILSILGTGSLAMCGPKFVAWWNATPTKQEVRFDCPNCVNDVSTAYLPWGVTVTGKVIQCDYCGVHLRFTDKREQAGDMTTGNVYWSGGCFEEATPTVAINGVQQYQ